MPDHEVCHRDELPPGSTRILRLGPLVAVGIVNCGGELFAIEDRCSHDDGPLCEGELDCDAREVICPRHGARFDLATGEARLLPAYIPVEVYPVRVRDDGIIVVDIP